jgi:hypothetical protein
MFIEFTSNQQTTNNNNQQQNDEKIYLHTCLNLILYPESFGAKLQWCGDG